MFHHDHNTVLIPVLPTRRLVFGDYLDRGTRHKLFAGEYVDTVCRSGADPYLYYIESGAIGARFVHADGTSLQLYRRDAGGAFQGEFAGIASIGTTRLRFTALENSVLTSFSYDTLYELVKEDPRAFEDLVYTAHMCFGQFGHRLDNMSAQSSSGRILAWLKKLKDTNTPDADGVYRIVSDMTVQDISDLLLIHVTTCSRLLSALKAKGIVDRTKRYLIIQDPAALEELARQENPLLY